MKKWKGEIAEGLRRARRAAGPGHKMRWTPAGKTAEALLMTTRTVFCLTTFFCCIDRMQLFYCEAQIEEEKNGNF